VALAALDLGVKAWAEHALADGRPVDLGLLQLRLLFNPGIALSLRDTPVRRGGAGRDRTDGGGAGRLRLAIGRYRQPVERVGGGGDTGRGHLQPGRPRRRRGGDRLPTHRLVPHLQRRRRVYHGLARPRCCSPRCVREQRPHRASPHAGVHGDDSAGGSIGPARAGAGLVHRALGRHRGRRRRHRRPGSQLHCPDRIRDRLSNRGVRRQRSDSNWERLPAVRDARSLRQSAPHASYGRSGRSGRACRCAWLQEPGEVGRRGDIHLGHRKILEAIGHGQHLLRFRPTKVGSSPRASSSRSTRCPVYPVGPSNPILRLSTALPSDGLCRVVSWPAG